MKKMIKVFAGFLSSIFMLISTTSLGQFPLEIHPLVGDFYVFTTYQKYRGIPYPSNGLYMVTEEGVVMIDTPWDTTQFQPILDSIAARHDKEVILTISTHWHEDRTGGVEFFKSKGISTYSSEHTAELCLENGVFPPEFTFRSDTTFTIGDYSISTFYPGHGHTIDNIVVWFEDEKILYGGCLIRSYETKGLGYTQEADLTSWPRAIETLQENYPKAKHIIPGHQGWSEGNSLDHTLNLFKDKPGG